MKKIVIVIEAIVIVCLAAFLLDSRQELKEVRQELKATESILTETREQEQIEAFLRTAIALYADGKKKEAYKFLEYAIFKMADINSQELGMLPAKMLKDPIVAKKLGIKKGSRARNVLKLHSKGGGILYRP